MLTKTQSENAVLTLLSRSNPDILTIAHRGVWTHAPENSLAAIRAAIELGVEIVEIDAQACADGQIMVIHDETLDRTSTATGIVSQTGFEAMRAARLRMGGGGPDAAVTDETVPTLAEALEEARGRIAINIDTKYPADLDAIADLVSSLSMNDQVILKTDVDPAADRFDVMSRKWFTQLAHMPMFPIRPGHVADDLKRIAILKPPMIEVRFSSIADLASAREELQRQNIRLWINTLDVSHCLDFNDTKAIAEPDAVWGTLIDAGAGSIQTDVSAAFKSYLAGQNTTEAKS